MIPDKIQIGGNSSKTDGIGRGDGPGPLPFDPEKTPPSMFVSDVIDWASERALWLIGAGILLAFGIWFFDVSISVPLWLRVLIATWVLIGAAAYVPVKRIIEYVYTPDTVTVSQVDPKEGDLQVDDYASEDWADVRFVNARGEQVDRSHVHRIQTGSGTALEVDWYDPESNVAQVSWMGGASNVEIRRHQDRIDDVRKRLSVVADQVLDLRANMEPTVRDAARETSMHLIEQYEGLTSATGDPISSEITRSVSSNVSEFDERLGDVEDVLDADDEELANGVGGDPSADSDEEAAQEAATDGGTESHE